MGRRIRLCRLIFMGCALAPTLGMLSWGAAHRLPSVVTNWQRDLGNWLGCAATLSDVTRPSPRVVLLHDLALIEPETGQVFFRCRLLEASDDGTTLSLAAEQPCCEASGMERVLELVERRLRHETPGTNRRMEFRSAELTWTRSGGALTFTDLDGAIEPTADAETARFEFRLAGVEMPDRASLSITRDRRSNPPRLVIDAQTGSQPIPCAPFSAWARAWLGVDCRFSGELRASQRRTGWQGILTGRFENIDLDALVSQHFPHKLSGLAQLELQDVTFRADRLTTARGTLTARDGVISRSLIQSAGQWLKLNPRLAPIASAVVRYRQLGFGFEMDEAGLVLTGQAGARTPGAILVDTYETYWREPRVQPQPIVSLVRALVPANDVQVPATRETDWLIRRLPLSEVVPPPSRDGSRRDVNTHLRVREDDENP